MLRTEPFLLFLALYMATANACQDRPDASGRGTSLVKAIRKRTHKVISHECGACKATFDRLNLLRSHELIHDEERPYQCEICKECFKRQNHLTTHMRIHDEEEPYQCENCKRKFKQPWHLETHQRGTSCKKSQAVIEQYLDTSPVDGLVPQVVAYEPEPHPALLLALEEFSDQKIGTISLMADFS